jgi:HAMP domain-containing protein
MRRHLTLTIGAALVLVAGVCLLPATAAVQQDYSHIRVVRVSLAEGDVRMTHADGHATDAELLNMPVRHGDLLRTAGGHAEIEFEDGAMIRLAEHTEIEFTELALADGRRITRVTVLAGTASFHVPLSRGEIFGVRTPHLEVAGSNRSEFRVDVLPEATFITVHRGDAQVETAAGSHNVGRGRTLSFGPGTAGAVQLARAREDEWDRWVRERHNAVTAAASAARRYVNAPVRYGMADLALYGSWVNVGIGSGYGWRPHGVGLGWAPFTHGYWRYAPGIGWFWASADPWGWMPYHFGYWHYSNLYGWLWMPDAYWYWRPGHVRWFQHNGRLCWAPYSPFDRPGAVPFHSPIGCAVSRTAGSSQPRGIRGVVARLNPGAEPTPLDGPPEAPAELVPSDGRGGIRGAADRASHRRESGIVYDPETGSFINRDRPAPGATLVPRETEAAPAGTGSDLDTPQAPERRRGIRGLEITPGGPVRPERSTPAVRPERAAPPAGVGRVDVQPRATPRRGEDSPRPADSPRREPRVTPRDDSQRPQPPPPPPRVQPRSEPAPPPAPRVEPRPAPPPPPPPRSEPAPERPQPQASGIRGATARPRPSAPATASPQRASTPARVTTPPASSRPAGTSAAQPPAGSSASRPAPSRGVSGAAQRARPQPQPRPQPN